MRKKIFVAVLSGSLVLGGGAYTAYARTGHDSPTARPAAAAVATAEVVKTNLSDYWTESGTVGYGKQRILRGIQAGVITWLPKQGRTVARGDTLYRVGDRPVALFYGSSPMFRDIGTVGMIGRDIKLLVTNLRALGYRVGDQPDPGTSVTVQGDQAPPESTEEGAAGATPAAPSSYRTVVTAQDGVFTASLKDALKRWQAAEGVRPADGTLKLGDVLVLPGAVRVGAAATQLGGDAAGNLMAVSDRTKVVTVDIAASRADDLKAGHKVQISLPDSTTTGGTVRSVSTNVQAAAEGDDPTSDGPKVQVVITVDKASAIKDISSADVEVRFTGTTKSNVLAVPVGALLALSGGGYGVQIPGGALTAVKVGMFADGMVQITGDGITAGSRVVTTAS